MYQTLSAARYGGREIAMLPKVAKGLNLKALPQVVQNRGRVPTAESARQRNYFEHPLFFSSLAITKENLIYCEKSKSAAAEGALGRNRIQFDMTI